MANKHVTEYISRLDAERDHQEIIHLLNGQVFPWDIERALEFALFRTYAVPAISGLLVETGELVDRPRKRYDDTELIMYTLTEYGYDSDEGRRALRRMNKMHGRFPISNDDFLYVLTTFIYEPIRWIEKYGWRPLAENEKMTFFYFYREVGKRMGIKEIPEDYDTFEQFNIAYEQENFRLAPSNRPVGDSTCDLVLGFYLPKPLWPLGRPFLYALMDEPLRAAFDFPRPSRILRFVANSALKARSWVIRWLPERRDPLSGTRRKRPTYPEGYKIEELGTFDR